MGSGIKFISEVLNQKGAPALYEDIIDNRPAATFEGRLFFATDVVSGDTIFRDNGDGTWSALAGNGGGGGITTATNGLSIYDDTAVGLGGTLTQPETIINGNTFLFRTTNSYDNQQGFYLNFDGEIYTFGIEENNNGDAAYTSYSSNNIFTQIYDDTTSASITINHGAGDYYITREYDYYDGNLTSYNILFANYLETNLRHSLTFVDDEENTFVVDGRIRIICDEQQLVHYNLLNIPVYADSAAALAAGLIVGDLYRHDNILEAGDQLRIVH